MSMKVNKNGKEYPLGFVPQSLYDDVANIYDDVESFTPTAKSGCTISSVTAAYTKKIGHLRYIYLNISIAKTAQQPQITLPFNCADMYMDISSSHNDNLVDAIVRNNVLYCAFPDSTSATVQVRCSGMVMC